MYILSQNNSISKIKEFHKTLGRSMQDWKFYNVKVEGGCVEEGREREVSEIRAGRRERRQESAHFLPCVDPSAGLK